MRPTWLLAFALLLSGCASEEPVEHAPLDDTPIVEDDNGTVVGQEATGPITGYSAVCHGAPDTDTGKASLEIDSATWGLSYSLEFRSGAAHVLYRFVDATENVLVEESGGVSQGGSWSFTGTVPDQAAQLVMFACENTFDEDFTYTAG